MRRTGDRVPDFDLATDRGDRVSTASLRGKRYVLYFYPQDDTPGCTREACSFRDHLPSFEGAGVPVYGVSADDVGAHARFVAKHQLNFPLLADPDRQLIQAMGVWVEKSLYGRRYFGIARATFVVSADGRIEKVWEKVSPDGHGPEVLAYLRGEAPPAKPAPAPAAKLALAARIAPKPVAPAGKAAVKKPVAGKPAAAKRAASKPAAKKVAKQAAKKATTKVAKKPAQKPARKATARKATARKAAGTAAKRKAPARR